MSGPELASVIHRGYAANAADEKRLKALGVTKPIYRADRGEVLGRFRMRRGELLAVVRGYLAFGEARRDWVRAEEVIHSMGAAILDLDTGFRSDRNGAKMFARAIHRPRPTDVYREMQAASVASRTKGRMKTRQAEKIWFNQKLKIAEKVELTGIPQATLYKMFGRTNVPLGRRKN